MQSMGSALTDLLFFIIAISILVAVHEYGHYIIGRWAGMKVLRFSVGFGKPIWSRRAGADNTEYCIAAIPLGGYVRFLDSREGDIDPADEGRAFDQRPIPARIAVLLAGPAFNFLLAIAVYWYLLSPGVMVLQPAVGNVVPDSFADKAGLQYGDKIVAIGDKQPQDWESALVALLDAMVTTGEIRLTLESERGGTRQATIDVGSEASRLTEPGVLFDGLGFEIWQPPALVGGLTAGGPAQGAGLMPGDLISSVDGEEIASWNDLLEVVRTRPGEPVDVTYLRDGESATVSLTLAASGTGEDRRGIMGVERSETFLDYYTRRTYSPLESLGAGVAKTWESTLFTIRMLGRMVTGDVSMKNISGPINIAQYAGESAERGMSSFLGFMAIISISLGVLNLLPIPVLDGGQIVYQAAEWIKGSPLTDRAQIIGQQVGILALLLLMSFAFYNDIARILN